MTSEGGRSIDEEPSITAERVPPPGGPPLDHAIAVPVTLLLLFNNNQDTMNKKIFYILIFN